MKQQRRKWSNLIDNANTMTKKLACNKCAKILPSSKFPFAFNLSRGFGYTCKQCNNKTARQYHNRIKYNSYMKRWVKLNKNKKNARTRIGNLLRGGKITKQNCFLCGSSSQINAHHIDYNFPSKIIWLCRKHHIDLHRNEKTLEELTKLKVYE